MFTASKNNAADKIQKEIRAMHQREVKQKNSSSTTAAVQRLVW